MRRCIRVESVCARVCMYCDKWQPLFLHLNHDDELKSPQKIEFAFHSMPLTAFVVVQKAGTSSSTQVSWL